MLGTELFSYWASVLPLSFIPGPMLRWGSLSAAQVGLEFVNNLLALPIKMLRSKACATRPSLRT